MDHCLDDLNKQNETPVATRPETVVRVLRKAKQIKDTDLGERKRERERERERDGWISMPKTILNFPFPESDEDIMIVRITSPPMHLLPSFLSAILSKLVFLKKKKKKIYYVTL